MRSFTHISQQVNRATAKPMLVVMGTQLLVPSSVQATVSVMTHLSENDNFFQLYLSTIHRDLHQMLREHSLFDSWSLQEINATPVNEESWKSKLHPSGAVAQTIADNLPTTFRLNNRAVLLVPAMQLRMMTQQCEYQHDFTLVPINTWDFSESPSHQHSADMIWMREHALQGYESLPRDTASLKM